MRPVALVLALPGLLPGLLLGLLLGPAVGADGAAAAPTTTTQDAQDGVVVVEQPRVQGVAAVGRTLRADPGRWDPEDVDLAYRWLRDGQPIGRAREATYVVRPADLGERLAVEVTATHPDGADAGSATAVAAAGDRVGRGTQADTRRPRVLGVARYSRTVRATEGRWRVEPDRVAFQWLRDGKPVEGATEARYTFAPRDVGHRLRVAVTSYVEGYRPATATSRIGPRVRHRVDVQRQVTYEVVTRGRITADVDRFARLAQQTFDDARGWRARGVQFRRVADGGSFSLVLAEASTVPSFSSECSATYSCRVGRFVIINQTRWQQATPAWDAGGRSLRDYRHMVVNHEVGHWLGKGHAGCPGPGRLAPVMMQQSKGTDGCLLNPWPTTAELG